MAIYMHRTALCLREQTRRLRGFADVVVDPALRRNLADVAAQCESIAIEMDAECRGYSPVEQSHTQESLPLRARR